MSRKLDPGANLESLRKHAKNWLKSLKAGDSVARERLAAAWSKAPASPTLRDVQHSLALEHGFTGWAALKEELAHRAAARLTPEERLAIVLRTPWDAGHRSAAARVAMRFPELARHSIHAAVAFGNLDEVKRRLAADPSSASAKGGPEDREPLQILAYARLPLPAVGDNALAIANLLLDHGADPNSWFDDGWGNHFTVLTGVIGRGEGVRPEHPRDRELAALLVDRGADPFDIQAMYNTSIVDDDIWWLDFMWSRTAARGEQARWQMRGKGVSLGGPERNNLDYLLGNAVNFNHPRRVEWLLVHGADPDGTNAYSKRPHLEMAPLRGYSGIAALLERHGAKPVQLSHHFDFHLACMRLDEAEARRLLAAHPVYASDPGPLLFAAEHNRTDILRLLLDLGLPVDLATHNGQRALHSAAGSGAIDAIRLLIDAGADIDRRGGDYKATPLGHGVFWKRQEVIDLIAPLSRDPHDLAWGAQLDRLRIVLDEQPALANAVNPNGHTPLLSLPDDEEAAAEAVEILLAHGADPNIKNPEGNLPDQVALKRGLDEAAGLIRAARG